MKFAVFFLFCVSYIYTAPTEQALHAIHVLGLPNEALKIRSHFDTSFSCVGRNGYYADVANDCQVYHVCFARVENGVTVFHHFSFICPNNTIFNQKSISCVNLHEASCVAAEVSNSTFVHVNEYSVAYKYYPVSTYGSNKVSNIKSVKTIQESIKTYQEPVNFVHESVKTYPEAVKLVHESVKTFNESAKFVQDSVKTYSESGKFFQEPVKTFNESAKVFQESAKIYPESGKLVHESVKTYPEAAKLVHESVKTFNETAKFVQDSVKTYPESVKFVQESVKIYQEPVKVQESVKVVRESIKSFQEPAKHLYPSKKVVQYQEEVKKTAFKQPQTEVKKYPTHEKKAFKVVQTQEEYKIV